jgi:cytochrome c5
MRAFPDLGRLLGGQLHQAAELLAAAQVHVFGRHDSSQSRRNDALRVRSCGIHREADVRANFLEGSGGNLHTEVLKIMYKPALIFLLVLFAMSVAMAQYQTPPTPGSKPQTYTYTPSKVYTYKGGADVLGAHNGYGRGCVMCHAPHSGAMGNGVSTADPQNGMYALWGQDVSPLFGASFNFSGDGAATYPVTLPTGGTITSAFDANTVILFCLSCHDGVVTKVAMMQGQTVETLPIVGGTAPTLLGLAAPTKGTPYSNDHPVGGSANVSCGGGSNWDCAATGGGNSNTYIVANSGKNMTAFMTNYPASFWNYDPTGAAAGYPLASFAGTTVNAVTCTTCHNQHSMTAYVDAFGTTWTTMFFIRGYYYPAANGNSVAQFCRNCHGGESNEMNGVAGRPFSWAYSGSGGRSLLLAERK